MSGGRVPRRLAALLVAGVRGLVIAPPSVPGRAHRPRGWTTPSALETANVVRRANIILGLAAAAGARSSCRSATAPMGAAVWGAGGFTAQLNRNDTWPTRRSPGQVTIPGLAPLTDAADYSGSVDLYDATFRQSGGGMTATTYVRADKDQLVIDVTGADPNSTQTARMNLQSGRNPTAGAERRDRPPRRDVGGHRLRSPAAPARRSAASPPSRPAAASVTARVVDARTVEISFRPSADGTFRVIVAAPDVGRR